MGVVGCNMIWRDGNDISRMVKEGQVEVRKRFHCKAVEGLWEHQS